MFSQFVWDRIKPILPISHRNLRPPNFPARGQRFLKRAVALLPFPCKALGDLQYIDIQVNPPCHFRRRLDVRHSLLNICFVGFDTDCCRLTLSFIGMGLFPKLPSKRERIDVQILPPDDFFSGLMQLPMVAAC